MLSKYNLTNKTAIITGGAGLLGIEHAYALLECDANVCLTDINQMQIDSAINKLKAHFPKGNISGLLMDVSSQESILSVKNTIRQVDILINNAAINPKVDKNSILETSRLENFSVDDWDFQLKVGLTGAMLCSQIFGTEMAKKGSGVILNIASDLSVFAPDQRLYKKDGLNEDKQPVKPVTYSVIKHGLIGLTKYLATYWAEQGVRCNALSPGGVYTNQNDDFVNKLSQLIPMGKMANKNDYHGAIQFLCSDASSYMNGQNIVLDGGRSIW